MRLFLVLSLSLLSQVVNADYKCTIGGDIFQTEISFQRSFENGQISEIILQELVRGEVRGPAKVLKAELINNYQKGWTYRVHLQNDFYGIVDDHAGKGSIYVNLIFGQGSFGMCRPMPTPNS